MQRRGLKGSRERRERSLKRLEQVQASTEKKRTRALILLGIKGVRSQAERNKENTKKSLILAQDES